MRRSFRVNKMPTPKLCKDLDCHKETWKCIKCRNIMCRHFCVQRDEKGIALCTKCLLEEREKSNATV